VAEAHFLPTNALPEVTYMSKSKRPPKSKIAAAGTLAASLSLVGCMVGPDYTRPPVPTAKQWVEAPTTQISTDPAKLDWWASFNDPVLDKLVQMAYQQNLSLQVAGLRVLEARAQRGIAVGNFFPQMQQINAAYSHNGTSLNNAIPLNPRNFDSSLAAFDIAWEVDVWGKFRRGIESSDASLYSSVMSYDDAMVTLIADVASTYVNIRGLDQRIEYAQENVRIQQQALDIANVRFRAGGTTELDVQQAKAQLADTAAAVPVLQEARQQAEDQLCTLLGIPPTDLSAILGPVSQPIPSPPNTVAVGIPAELLRRRPDIRRAEADAEAQCAQIGVAVTDLLPHFQLAGTIGFTAADPGSLFRGSSLAYQVGPSFQWNILNYGQITNNVRVQDARFEELLTAYQNTILAAQQDVGDSITSLIHSREQASYLDDSVTASLRSVELAIRQYKAGGTDFIRVLNATQFLFQEQDSLAISRINVATSAISLNRALGGGWEIQGNNEFVPAATVQRMRSRTDWGDITDPNYASKKDMMIFPRPDTEMPPSTQPSEQ
jgi:NodT family efflux transporter outer membrane factor (OMF) lipoprotein